jgi:hypothetical protein
MVRAIPFSRRASRPSFAARTKATEVSPPNKKGRRSAGRRKSNGPHHTNRCRHLSALRARRAPRTFRLREPPASGALASRRSTAALAGVSRPRLFDFRPGFLGRGCQPALPALACPSPAAAPRAPAVIPADMMPEAARERFAKPPAGTAPAPHLQIASGMRPSMGGLFVELLHLRSVSRTNEFALDAFYKRRKTRRFCARLR